MPEISRIKDEYYIVATSSIVDPYRLILKDGDLFGVFDRFGDILPVGKNEQGLYYKDTRFISYYELKINSLRPLFLSSNIDEDNILLTVDLTNPDIYSRDKLLMKRDSVHIMRSRLLQEQNCLEYIRLKNFGNNTIEFNLEITIDADFHDIFEVRGLKRKKRGVLFPSWYRDGEFRLSYKGLDDIKRITSIKFKKVPDVIKNNTFSFKIKLRPSATEQLYILISCFEQEEKNFFINYNEAIKKSYKKLNKKNINCAEIYTSNEQFNESIKRSLSDINMMLTKTKFGYYPYGGIPWYCNPFGRDGIITAIESLWIRPEIAKGVLKYLSALQSKDFDPKKVAEPGKIIHEVRAGEMARLNEIPFGLYYGSVDSTPLFLMLAGAYWSRTGDTNLIKELWRNIEAAISWIDNYGDIDKDGFLEYVSDKKGLRNQGWKDSQDSVFHKDGTLAEGPIALCEVQAYVYAAKKEISKLAQIMGDTNLSKRLLDEAEILRDRFNKIFWDDEIDSYILALDGNKIPCRVVTSNAGHALFAGIADSIKATKLAKTLISDKVFSGWGIRTVSADEKCYNPMSYHNGSVWPHDNALIAFGLSSYGLKEHFLKVFSGIFDISLFMEFQRLPELICGFHRRKGVPPTLYPVACSPQTWSAGSLIFMLQASLGISFEAKEGKIIFKQPVLPQFLDNVHIKNLTVTKDSSIDLLIRRYGEDVTIEVLQKPKDISILIIK